jgi:hypothetical protein
MISSGANVIIWYKMLSSEANFIMVSSGANVIIWCYHVMLSSGMITPPFFVFPGNFTHSYFEPFWPHLDSKLEKSAKTSQKIFSKNFIKGKKHIISH